MKKWDFQSKSGTSSIFDAENTKNQSNLEVPKSGKYSFGHQKVGLSLLKWDSCVDRYVAMDKTPVKKPKALNSELRVLGLSEINHIIVE